MDKRNVKLIMDEMCQSKEVLGKMGSGMSQLERYGMLNYPNEISKVTVALPLIDIKENEKED